MPIATSTTYRGSRLVIWKEKHTRCRLVLVNTLEDMQVHKSINKLSCHAMAFVLKILAALVVVIGTLTFPSLIFVSQSFRAFYWNLMGQNIQYAAVGAIATFAFIIALASLIWNKE